MTERNMTCIICPMGCAITVKLEGEQIAEISGNTCKRGAAYAEAEISHPERTLTTTIRCTDGRMLSVKTDRPIPKAKMMECMQLINGHTVTPPVAVGDIVMENVCGSRIVATQGLT